MNILLHALLILNGFDAHKSSVKDLISGHLRLHPECEGREILGALRQIEIVESFHINANVAGWLHEGKIFINSNKRCKWTDRKIALFLIHELIHACGHCLNDSIRSYDRPICTFFRKKIYHSQELTEAIKKHFKESK